MNDWLFLYSSVVLSYGIGTILETRGIGPKLLIALDLALEAALSSSAKLWVFMLAQWVARTFVQWRLFVIPVLVIILIVRWSSLLAMDICCEPERYGCHWVRRALPKYRHGERLLLLAAIGYKSEN